MSNEILKYGIATPFVLFNFGTVGSIESKDIPRYFVSLEHNRTCTKACTFKLTVIYVPDTFSAGTPNIIDQMLIATVRQQVTYQYGYYDYLGVRHVQQQLYVGQVYTYDSSTNVANGTITYTIEGTSHVAQLTDKLAEIKGSKHEMKPSIYLDTKLQFNENKDNGFSWLKKCYAIKIDHSDMEVPIPNLGTKPVLDLIMGTSNNITKNDGTTAKVGGLVNYSVAPLSGAYTMEQLHNKGLLSNDAYNAYQRGMSGEAAAKFAQRIRTKLGTPYKCYVDDVHVDGKYGTFYYVPGAKNDTDAVYSFDYGNHFQDSDVLSFSATYDGSVALAAASATDNVSASIDAGANPVGASSAITQVNNLSRNTYPTMSGFDEDVFLSQKELSDIMLYPFEASMTVMGQLKPSQLLDIIYVQVTLNGTPVTPLTGRYQIIEINDSVSDGGFTTTFNLVRFIQDKDPLGYLENVVSTSWQSDAKDVQEAINQTDSQRSKNNESQVKAR